METCIVDGAMNTIPDEKLFSRFQNEHRAEDLELLVIRHRSLVFRIAYGVTADATLAEEAVQEVLLRLVSSASSYEAGGPGSFRAWLSMLALNIARHGLKVERRKRRFSSCSILAKEIRSRQENSFTREPNSLIISDELQSWLFQALRSLPEDMRSILILYFIENRPQTEIGKLTGKSQSQVSRRILKGLRNLRAQFNAV